MANNDRVYLAYSGQLGEQFEHETKNRIQWILDQAQDRNSVLDIGCSQGIVSILLAEEGKKVTGIDIQEEAIDFAKTLLHDKYSNVQDKVDFECINFMDYQIDKKYDCIVITEVLEHLNNPEDFLKKAAYLLDDNGAMIISVPFGVMDHPDHVSTFYMTNFYDLVNSCLDIYSLTFMGRWMGVVAGHKGEKGEKIEIDVKQIKAMEKNFEIIDRKMSQRIDELYRSCTEANGKYKQSIEQYRLMKEQYNSIKEKHDLMANRVEVQEGEFRNQIEAEKKQVAALQSQIEEEKKQIANLQSQIEEEKKQMANLRSQIEEKKQMTEKYQSVMMEDYRDLDTTIKIIEELNQKIKRLNGQYKNSVDLNEQYRTRLEKIESNLIWKYEIKVYRKIKMIKNKILRG